MIGQSDNIGQKIQGRLTENMFFLFMKIKV